MRPILFALLACTAFSVLAATQQPPEPRDGRAVLERMHAAYAGKWYTQLAFVQRTLHPRADGGQDSSTWYESFKGADQMRIDFGDPAGGRGVLFTAESTFVFKDGQLLRSAAEGNPFLPIVMGVYAGPVAAAARGAAHHKFDLTKVHRSTWEGQPVYVVGAASDADTTSAQFWVETKRLQVVRMRVPGSPGEPPLDIRLDKYVPVGAGWLATQVTIARGGKPLQIEEYTEWSDRVTIPDSLFTRKRWVTRGHWVGKPRGAGWAKGR